MRRPVLLTVTALVAAGMTAGVTGTAVADLPSQASATAAEAVPDELLIGYDTGTPEPSKARARSRASAAVVEQVVPEAADRRAVELVRLPRGRDRAQAIAQIEDDPNVAYAEPNFIYQAAGKPSGDPATAAATPEPYQDPYFANGSLWGVSATPTVGIGNEFGSQASAAWGPAPAGARQVYIGVIDEGIKVDHPDLAGQVRNPGEIAGNRKDDDRNGYVDDVYGWDFAGRNNTVYDGGSTGSADNHGTHVAGTIAAKADGAGVIGVAPQGVKLISAKFLTSRGGSLSNAIKAIDYFTALKRSGVDVVATNNSWGGGGFSLALHDSIVAGAREGILFIAAAGNGGSDGKGDNNDAAAYYPSDYTTGDDDLGGGRMLDVVVSVAAIDNSGGLASFSNYGLADVDLGAPGVGIWSTTANNGGFSSYDGTSMATPHVTGALGVAALRTTAASGRIADAERLARLLLTNTTSTAFLEGRTATGGRVDVKKMLNLP